jgi:hypothetical protein
VNEKVFYSARSPSALGPCGKKLDLYPAGLEELPVLERETAGAASSRRKLLYQD